MRFKHFELQGVNDGYNEVFCWCVLLQWLWKFSKHKAKKSSSILLHKVQMYGITQQYSRSTQQLMHVLENVIVWQKTNLTKITHRLEFFNS